MRKKAVNLTISEEIRARAERTMAARGFSSFSAYVEQLIREEYERRGLDKVAILNESIALSPAIAKPVSYRKTKPRK